MNLFRSLRRKPVSDGRPWLEFPNETDTSPQETLLRVCGALWRSELESKHAEIEGQGLGSREGSYEIKCFKVFMRVVHIDDVVSDAIMINLRRHGIETARMLANGKGFDLTTTTPDDASKVLNELFVTHFKLKPYNESGHYNVAAYWT